MTGGFFVGGSAVGSAFSFGLWDGGAARCDPAWGVSRTLAEIGAQSAMLAATAGAGAGEAVGAEALEVEAATAAEEGIGETIASEATHCFVAGTPVAVAGTNVPIERVHTGNWLLTCGEALTDSASGTSSGSADSAKQQVVAETRRGSEITLTLRDPNSGKETRLTGRVGRDHAALATPAVDHGRATAGSTPTADGFLPIERVHAGLVVPTGDPETGRTEYRHTLRTIVRPAPDTVTLELADPRTGRIVQRLTGTPGHRFFVEGGGLLPMGQLNVGTRVLTRDGVLRVASTSHRDYPQGVLIIISR